jgi:hypothetical protein
MSSRRFAVRPMAIALATVAVASPAATAMPIDPVTPRERQALASRGVGAPNPPAADSPYARGFGGARDALAKQPAPPPAPTADPGFDWGALALGAAGASVVIALFAFGVPALGTRVRTAR